MNNVIFSKLKAFSPSLLSLRGMRRYPPPPRYDDVVMPPVENRSLPVLDPVPFIAPGLKGYKYQRRVSDIRGPELIHNTFMYKQYGVIALSGGNLMNDHLQQIRETVNRHLNTEKAFAIWRIDPPWKSICRRGQGKRMGGGRPSISFYVTPVRAGRVILEVGGLVQFEEVLPFLNTVCSRLPFNALAIDYHGLNELRDQYKKLQAQNVNPINFKRCVELNMINCRSPGVTDEYDQLWFGKYD